MKQPPVQQARDYRATFSFTTDLGGEPVRVVSKPGLEEAERVPDAAALAAELVTPEPGERVLLLGCGHGALGVALGRRLPHGSLTLADPSLIALRMARLTLDANELPGVAVSDRLSLLPEGTGSFDRVLIMTPPARDLGRRWLLEAMALLRPGGALNIAGPNAGGVQSLIADAEALCSSARVLGFKRGCRVAEARRPTELPAAPSWAAEPGIAPGSWRTLRVKLPHDPVELVSLPGVFSYNRLDTGTEYLLQNLELKPGLRVLDAGCGYGPIGIAAARAGAARVDLLDVNLPAVAAAHENIARLGLTNAAAVPSDALEAVAGRHYDLIVSNPPFHAGKNIDYAMAGAFIEQGRALLNRGGRFVLVANRFLPYERLLEPRFRRVARLAESRAYHVIAGEV